MEFEDMKTKIHGFLTEKQKLSTKDAYFLVDSLREDLRDEILSDGDEEPEEDDVDIGEEEEEPEAAPEPPKPAEIKKPMLRQKVKDQKAIDEGEF